MISVKSVWKWVFAILASVALLLAGTSIASANGPSSSSGHGSKYDHIDVKVAASYTVKIDGVSYILSGEPVQNSITVKIGEKTYDFDKATSRTESGLYEFNLGTDSFSPNDDIEWASSDSKSADFWKMSNVYVTATIKLDKAELNEHLGAAAISHLVNLGLIEHDGGEYYVHIENEPYAGIQECTGGNGMRSDGKSSTPTGLDLILSAEDTALAITQGKLVIQKKLVDETGASIDGENEEFHFTLQYHGSSAETAGSYVAFDNYEYKNADASNTAATSGVVVTVSGNEAVTLTELPAGIYTLTELQTVSGYIVSAVDGITTTSYTKDYTIESKQDGDIPVAIFTNMKISDGKAGLSIKKVSTGLSDGASYPNPHVTITEKASGTVVWSGELPANGDTYYLNTLLEKGKTYVVSEHAASVPGYTDSASLVIGAEDSASSAVEADDPSGMEFTVTPDDLGQQIALTLKNEYAPTTSVTATKVWDDGENQDGLRDETKNVTLYLTKKTSQNGEAVKVEGSEKTISSLATSTAASVTWEDLPVKEDGADIIYGVAEVPFDGYTTEIVKNPAGVFEVKNIHEPETVSVTVNKTWSNVTHPDSATVVLHKNGEPVDEINETSGTQTIGAEGNWKYTWTGLPKYESGALVSYTVEEQAMKDYVSTVAKDADEAGNVTVNLTNTYDPEHVSMHVGKAWVDDDNVAGARPSQVTFDLYAKDSAGDERLVKSVSAEGDLTFANGDSASGFTLSADNGWVWHFAKLPADYSYSVVERNVANYSPSYDLVKSGDLLTGITITNTLSESVKPVDIKAVKVWDDADDQDGIRPAEVTFNLYAYTSTPDNAQKYGSRTLTADSADSDGNWVATWEDLPAYYNGAKVTYFVAEDDVPEGYTSKVEKTDDASAVVYTVTNKHEPATIDIPVIKRWVDGGHDAGDHLDNPDATIILNKKVGSETAEAARIELPCVDAESGKASYSYEFEDMPLYENGQLIEYFVTEVEVLGYETHISGSAEVGFSVVNTREHTSISGTKTWVDGNDQDGLRPDSIEVTLWMQVEGSDAKTEVETLTVTPDNNGEWNYTFSNLHIYDNEGKTISYSVTEEAVPNYITTYSETGYDITNTHEPEVTNISGTKTWDDAGNQDGKRPESIVVRLYADGVEIDSKQVTAAADGTWSYSFDDVPMYANGELVEYLVSEDPVEGYVSKVTPVIHEDTGHAWIFNITNTLDEPLPDTGKDDEGDGEDEPLPGTGSSLSQTGDAFLGIIGVIVLVAVAAAGVAIMARSKARAAHHRVTRR